MNTQEKIRYSVAVESKLDGLTPVYEALIIRDVWAGISGPFSETFNAFSLAEVENWIATQGYARTSEYAHHINHSTAKLVRVF